LGERESAKSKKATGWLQAISVLLPLHFIYKADTLPLCKYGKGEGMGDLEDAEILEATAGKAPKTRNRNSLKCGCLWTVSASWDKDSKNLLSEAAISSMRECQPSSSSIKVLLAECFQSNRSIPCYLHNESIFCDFRISIRKKTSGKSSGLTQALEE
jgi:hypothetical protein